MNATRLKQKIRTSLQNQGFAFDEGRLVLPSDCGKDFLRKLHAEAVAHRIERARRTLQAHETWLLEFIADGHEVDPEAILPRIVVVKPRSDEELLFRYASLHWSIPVSSGYGRRLRFLVMDEQNCKLIGIIGLGDPVFGLRARDQWIGWSSAQRRSYLAHVMDAFVLGAVPPYSSLLCGKLIAMLAASNELRYAFKKKYFGRKSLIRRKEFDGRLALITTTSALGRSSIYNRIRFKGRTVYHHLGYTSGSGDFQFMNGLYETIRDFVSVHGEPSAKHVRWGSGFRNRREVIKICLQQLGLPDDLVYHGVQRELFGVPLARNSLAFLRGEVNRLDWYNESAEELFHGFRERWLMPRAATYSPESWSRHQWQIWKSEAG